MKLHTAICIPLVLYDAALIPHLSVSYFIRKNFFKALSIATFVAWTRTWNQGIF